MIAKLTSNKTRSDLFQAPPGPPRNLPGTSRALPRTHPDPLDPQRSPEDPPYGRLQMQTSVLFKRCPWWGLRQPRPPPCKVVERARISPSVPGGGPPTPYTQGRTRPHFTMCAPGEGLRPPRPPPHIRSFIKEAWWRICAQRIWIYIYIYMIPARGP